MAYDPSLITPEYVVNEIHEPTENYLCGHDANVYQINFTYFKIRAIYDRQDPQYADEPVGEHIIFEVGDQGDTVAGTYEGGNWVVREHQNGALSIDTVDGQHWASGTMRGGA